MSIQPFPPQVSAQTGARAPTTEHTLGMAKPLDLPTIVRYGVELRPWRVADAPALRKACGDQGIMRFTTVPGVFSEDAAIDWINRQRQHAERGTAIVLAILDAGGHVPVGMVGLFGLDRRDRTARLGYWLVLHARGRGLATAAARGLTAWGFDNLGLDRVVIDREPTNLASARVAVKLGAEQIGAHISEDHGSGVKLIRYVIHRPTD